jgi:hypothetical protein
MARMHILQQVGPNLYTVIVHAPTPSGTNAAGVAWSAAIASAGLATTRMPIGTGPGQISQAEADQVQNGAVIEASLVWQDDTAWTNAQRLSDLNLRAAQAVQAVADDHQRRLRFFGATVA